MRRKVKKSQLEEGSLLSALRAEKKLLSAEISKRVDRLTKVEELIASYEGKDPSPATGRLAPHHRPAASETSPFYGLALPEAVTKQLSAHTSPKTARQLWEEMKGHYPSTSKDPAHAVHWALRRREARVGDVMIIGEGKWAMRAWYTEEEQKRIDASLGPMAGRDRDHHIAKTKTATQNMRYRGVRIGAPLKMTPEAISKIRQLIGNGMSVAEACAEAGVKPSTFYAHRNKSGAFAGLKVQKKNRKSGSLEPDLLSRTGAIN